jgi:hypothetical protein
MKLFCTGSDINSYGVLLDGTGQFGLKDVTLEIIDIVLLKLVNRENQILAFETSRNDVMS